eukprot:841325-Amorphochlora_amoeboformis.AAC.1
MDADLQHEPESVPAVAEPVLTKKVFKYIHVYQPIKFKVMNIRLNLVWGRGTFPAVAWQLGPSIVRSTKPLAHSFRCKTKGEGEVGVVALMRDMNSETGKVISAGATLLAWPLSGSTDPMSGFFCTTKEVEI